MDIVHLLVNEGAEIDPKNKNGYTPLLKAIEKRIWAYWYLKIYKSTNRNELNWKSGHLNIVKYLVSNGANFSAVDNSRNVALNLAAGNENCIY